MERFALHLLHTRENHPGNPEKDDVIAGDQHVRGVKILEIRRPIGPAQRGKRPQRRRKPRIQHVRVTLDVFGMAGLTRSGILAADRGMAAIGTIPGRNLMSPPQLTGNAPVAHIVHPVQIGLAEPRCV